MNSLIFLIYFYYMSSVAIFDCLFFISKDQNVFYLDVIFNNF